MNDIIQWIGSLIIVGGGAAQASVWALKSSIEAGLNRSVQRDIEALKAENQRQLEHLKNELTRQSQLEVERQKANLQAELQKAQHTTTRLHDIYPELVQKLRVAEGAVAGLWGARRSTDLSRHDEADFAELLKRLRIPGEEREETLALLRGDKEAGIKQLERLQRRVELIDAREKINDLKNFVLLKEIYISKEVYEAHWAVIRKLSDAHVEVEVGEAHPGSGVGSQFFPLVQQASKDIPAIIDRMRSELGPQLGQPPTVPTTP